MDHNGDKCRGLFINVEQFLLETKKSITDRNQRLKEMEKLIPSVDLVIWDDFGNRSLSEYDFSLLYTYINERLNNGKSNIYTSNRIDDELARNVGWRVTDRVLNTSDVLEFINPSQRRPARERGRK
jgi:DNA replication protein DnaC